jgi:hypothetical protein
MEFENNELKLTYTSFWQLKEQDIDNCILVLDHEHKKSRIMLLKYPEDGINLNYLKSAVETIPRSETLRIIDSRLTSIKNFDVHEFQAVDMTQEPPLKTRSIGLIHNKDAYLFDYFTFGLNNPEDNDLDEIIKSLTFE